MQGAQNWTMDELEDIAKRFSVSRYVILRRLLTVGRTTQAHYRLSAPNSMKNSNRLEKNRAANPLAAHRLRSWPCVIWAAVCSLGA